MKMGSKSKIAVMALVLGIVCFLNLLGIEKAIAAIIAGWLGLKETDNEAKAGKGFAIAGIVLGSLYIVTITVVLIFKGPEFIQIIQRMKGY
jgi:hypothetical protein